MYDNHVFISYAHIDNLPISEEQQGWISRFHQTFSVFLSQRLGSKARIWRDQKLNGNDIFGDEIVDQFQRAALLLPILSPRYVRSDWCKREIHEFCQNALQSGGLVIDNKSRVFKIVKTPIDNHDALPAVVHDSLGYDFFLLEEQSPLELDPSFGERFKQDYLRKICILASDVASLLRHMETEAAAAAPIAAAAQPRSVVFLAACSFDQRDQREIIAADLRSHGYRVLPEDRLPSDDEDSHRSAVLPLIEQADLAIHLIGRGYGAVPDGPSHQSLVELHNALAAERSRSHGLRRLIWLPEGLSSDQPDQQRFLKALRGDAACQAGADLLSGTIEELRTQMHSALDAIANPEPGPGTAASAATDPAARRLIYLIAIHADRKASLPLRKWLKSQGIDVSLPAFEGDAAAVRRSHEQLLADCSAVVVFYGAGDDAWYRSVMMDLRRAPAYRDGRDLPAPLTVLSAPSSDDKDDLVDLEESDLIDARDGFEADALLSWLQQLTPP